MRPADDLPQEVLSPQQFATASGFSLATVRRYLKRGVLPKIQPAGPRGRVGIPRSALAAVQAAEQTPDPIPTASEAKVEPPPPKRLSGPVPRWLSANS